jgi:carbonic anhydrase/acetyltransferase-like protein (isoleucine patch superfamily)
MGYPISIGSGCTIGHHAILHGCEIADDCLIGMGATILNGAKIGAGSLVGAGALVTERKEFPERSLIIGSPAKMVRTLTDEDVEKIRNSARHYVENWRRMATGLKRIDG